MVSSPLQYKPLSTAIQSLSSLIENSVCFFKSSRQLSFLFFFFNDPPTPDIYPLPLHAALPIFWSTVPRASRSIPATALSLKVLLEMLRPSTLSRCCVDPRTPILFPLNVLPSTRRSTERSEEHTSELQSPCNLVCRLLLEKKKKL